MPVHAPSAAEATEPAAPQCPSCRTVFLGRYCPACGERRLDPEDLSVRRFVGESMTTLTDVDSSIYRTGRALLARPGLLTAEYRAGRRTPYLRPVQVFVLCNLLYFFLQPVFGFNTLTSELRVHMEQLPYSPLVRPLVEAEIRARGIDPREYEILFDATIASQAKTLVFAMIPLFALFVALLYLRSRRFFVEHVVFATHFFSMFLLSLLLLAGTMKLLVPPLRGLGLLGGWINSDPLWSGVLGAAWLAYLYPALRRVYGDGRAAAALRAVALTASLLVVIQLYRFLLFFTTFHAV